MTAPRPAAPHLTLLAAAAVTFAPASLPAQDLEDEVPSDGFHFYADITPAYLSFDDGEETKGTMVDNANSGTLFGFEFGQPLGGGTIGFAFETMFGIRSSDAVTQRDTPSLVEIDRTILQRAEGFYSGGFGTVWVGQGSMVTDGDASADLSGTDIVGSSSIGDVAGAFLLRESSGDLSDIAVGDAFDNLSGDLFMRIRYDTPSFSGLSLGASYGVNVLEDDDEAHYYDLGATYEGGFGDVQVAAAAGYLWVDDDGDTDGQFAASASALHEPTGLNLTFAAGTDGDAAYGYVKAGWLASFTSLGSTAFSVEWYEGGDFVEAGSSSTALGVAVVQEFESIGLSAYLGYRTYSYDDDLASYQDASSTMIGVSYSF